MEDIKTTDKEVVEETVTQEESTTQNSDSSSEKKDETKAYSERLKKDKAKIEKEATAKAREEVATSLGYESWEEMQREKSSKKLKEIGIDPKEAGSIIDEYAKTSSEYQELLKYKEEIEARDKENFVKTELSKLNEDFGINIKDVSELDEQTLDLWQKGVSLSNAYGAFNYEKLAEKKAKQVEINKTSKNHLNPVNGGNTTNTSNAVEPSKEKIKRFMAVTGITDEKKAREEILKRQK